jgi:phage recombination protein Bet
MTTELAVRENGSVPSVSWTPEQVDLIKRTIAVDATNDELQLFLYQAKRTGLDPLSRQIHFVKRQDKGTIQTAIDGYRLIADRTGKYAGNDDYVFDEGLPQYTHMQTGRGNPATATATVYKMVGGIRTAFTATAAWGEYAPANDKQAFMWKKMPYLMIGKCAEALALRKAFPAELSGVYTNEEMMQADSEPRQRTQSATPPQEHEPCAPNYGKYAKQPLSSIPNEGLVDYLEAMKRSINDPKKARFQAANQAMLEAIEAELTKREQAQPEGSTDSPEGCSPSHSPTASETSGPCLDADNVCEQMEKCLATDEVSALMNPWMAEVERGLHTKEDAERVRVMFNAVRARLKKR